MPITDADCIRGLACRALVGLSRNDTARQIMSKLPIFTSGQLQCKGLKLKHNVFCENYCRFTWCRDIL